MRKLIATLSAFALAVPATAAFPIDSAQAQSRTYKSKSKHSKARYYKKCRRSKGTTGLVVGGVAGAVAGPAIIGGGLLGTVAGGVAGALGGRALDRTVTAKKRCYWVRRR